MDKCVVHDKCYDNDIMCSSPPKQRWICRKCNEQGIDIRNNKMDAELFKNIKDGLQEVGEIERIPLEQRLTFAEQLALKSMESTPWLEKNAELQTKIQELEKIIASQRHELALQAKFREEDAHARQLLDKNACQRKVLELEARLDHASELLCTAVTDLRNADKRNGVLQTELADTEKRLDDATQRLDFRFENALWNGVEQQKAEEERQKKEDEAEFWKAEAKHLSWKLSEVSAFNRERYWKDALIRSGTEN